MTNQNQDAMTEAGAGKAPAYLQPVVEFINQSIVEEREKARRETAAAIARMVDDCGMALFMPEDMPIARCLAVVATRIRREFGQTEGKVG